MNDDDRALSKKDFEKAIGQLQEALVGGMNQMLETLVNHIDRVDNHVIRLENKVDTSNDNLKQRVAKLEKQQI